MTTTNTAVNAAVVAEDLLGNEVVKSYDNNNSGTLFKNKMRTKDTHPNSRGRVEVDGKHYWVSGWTRQSAAGEPFISMAFTAMTPEEVAKYVK